MRNDWYERERVSKDQRMVKVFFSLECEDGWPPSPVESVWARSTDEPHQYVIENTPFFVQSATLGDVVVARHRPASDRLDAQVLWFRERLKWAGNSLIRLIFRKRESKGEIFAWLERAGCICEGFEQMAMLAVSVPPEVDQATIQEYLNQREAAGEIYIEEAMLRQ
jgi:hypothetical protein